MQDARVARCLTAKRESKSIEFKEHFVPTDPGESLEILKDIVAIANSGGGALAVGINNQGAASGAGVKPTLDYDHAKYGDLIRKYTLQNFSDFEVVEAQKRWTFHRYFLDQSSRLSPCVREARHLPG